MSKPAPRIEVKPGQIWADKNQWNPGRTVRVVELDGRHVVLELVTEATNKWEYLRNTTIGRRSRVLYDELGVRGYRLVSQPEEQR